MDLSRHEHRSEDRSWRMARSNRRSMQVVILIASLLIGFPAGLALAILGTLWVQTRNLASFLPIDDIIDQAKDIALFVLSGLLVLGGSFLFFTILGDRKGPRK